MDFSTNFMCCAKSEIHAKQTSKHQNFLFKKKKKEKEKKRKIGNKQPLEFARGSRQLKLFYPLIAILLSNCS